MIGGGLAGLTAAATLATTGIPSPCWRAPSTSVAGPVPGTATGSTSTSGPTPCTGRPVGWTSCAASASLSRRRPRLDRAGVLLDGGPASRHIRRDITHRVRVLKAMTGLGPRAAAEWAGPRREWIEASRTTGGTGCGRVPGPHGDVQRRHHVARRRHHQRPAPYRRPRRALPASRLVEPRHGAGRRRPRRRRRDRDPPPADSVEHDERVHAVHLMDGRTLPAAAVVVAVNDPRRAAGLLSGDAAAASARWRRDRPRPHGPPRRRDASAAVDAVPHPARHRDAMYLNVPSSVADVAPDGGGVIQVARYLRPGEERGDHRPGLEAVLDPHQPNWRDHVVDARYVPRSLVSGDHARGATRAGRPSRRSTSPASADWPWPVTGSGRPGCSPTRRSCPAPRPSVARRGRAWPAGARSTVACTGRSKRSRPPARGCSASPTGCSAAGWRRRTSSVTSPSAGRPRTGRRSANRRGGWYGHDPPGARRVALGAGAARRVPRRMAPRADRHAATPTWRSSGRRR